MHSDKNLVQGSTFQRTFSIKEDTAPTDTEVKWLYQTAIILIMIEIQKSQQNNFH